MQNFFKSHVVDAARTQQIRIYIDALDECGEDVAIELVEFFRCFAAPVSICFSCRHYPFVALEGGDEICVEDENEQDIEIYVQEKIKAHIKRIDIAKTLKDEVVSRSRGNFQWVVLVIPRVIKLYRSRKSMATIQAMIQSIPIKLHKLYIGLLNLIEGQDRAQSLHLMQWICFSFRPLTVRELRLALAVNPDISYTSIRQCQNSEFYVNTDGDMNPVVYDLSKGLVEVKQHGSELIVQFIHQSVQDFLLDKGFQVLDNSIAGNVIGHGHLWISRSCIEYLFMVEVHDFADSLNSTDPVDSVDSPNSTDAVCSVDSSISTDAVYSVDSPNSTDAVDFVDSPGSKLDAELPPMEEKDTLGLFSYSSGHWLSHIRMLENTNMSQNDLTALSTAVSDRMLHNHFFRYLHHDDFYIGEYLEHHGYYIDGKRTLLHITTYCNIINVVRAVLTQTASADQTDVYGQTALSIAAERGHMILVELLLSRNDVDVDHKNSQGDVPLSSAAKYGHTAAVRTPLGKEDVDVNYQTPRGYAPLHLAAEEGHYDVVELLLQHNVEIDARDIFANTPLSLAAWEGHYEVVKLLLQRTSTTDSIDKYGRTPLSLAASQGHCEVVKLLLQRTSNADIVDNTGRTPLSYACNSGHEEIVEGLLKRNDVDVNSRDRKGRSVLFWAIGTYFGVTANLKNLKRIMDLLLNRHGIFIDKADEEALEKFRKRFRKFSKASS